MKKITVMLLMGCLLISCGVTKRQLRKQVEDTVGADFFKNQFTGFLLMDPDTGDTLYRMNSDKYFTPASNVKIFTLYTALRTLPMKIPALRYRQRQDTLYFEGTGDPSFLHHFLNDSTAYKFLKNQKHLAFNPNNFKDTKWGPGWPWDDYTYSYAPERSAFPLYGNTVMIHDQPVWGVSPNYFTESVMVQNSTWNRMQDKNIFTFNGIARDTLEIPFITNAETVREILQESMSKSIHMVSQMPEGEKITLFGMEADSLYKRMMHESDNFIAEQLLIVSSGVLTDTLNTENAMDYILKNDLRELPHPPRWVDGSGLSRYNLFTPQSIVFVLNKLYKDIPEKRLFALFPAGGVSGTLKSWFQGLEKPYIYAKSGSLGNNYCLSGYLKTKSGKVLIFSFMNNHFRHPSSELKKRMQSLFEQIRDSY